MYLVEIWVLLKTQFEEHHYNGRKLTQLQRQFPHVTYNFNDTEITTGIWTAYSGRETSTNQALALSIEFRTNLADTIEEVGKGPESMHVRNMQRRE